MNLAGRLTSLRSLATIRQGQCNLYGKAKFIRALSASQRLRDSASIDRNRPRSDAPRESRGPRSSFSASQRFEKDENRGKKNRSRRRREVKPVPARKLVLPDMGLTVGQLAALGNVPINSVYRCARELDDSIMDSTSILSPALAELVTEGLCLNLIFQPQTVPLITRGSSSDALDERRMPVVTVMGHVDHGKTSLLDALRSSDVAKHEVGGITQSVAAFQVPIKSKEENSGATTTHFATFIDTPGHAAFKKMRANGTVATDIVVLVVAADDGVMPQTIESANLARAVNVPIIVAINKCDAPGANPDKVRYQLLDTLDLNTEQLGGDIQCVEISAKTGHHLPRLLEAILVQAEILDLRSNPKAKAAGICLESRVDRAMGSIATVVVRSGTLKKGDHLAFQSPKALRGDLFGHVRSLLDRNGEQRTEAKPGVAVGIMGVRDPIPPGAEFCVERNEKAARAKSKEMLAKNAEAIATIQLANSLCTQTETVVEQTREDDEGTKGSEVEDGQVGSKVRSVVVLIRADMKGSADAVAQCLQPLSTTEYPLRVIEAGVGDVTEADIVRVAASRQAKGCEDEPFIVAFNVRARDAVQNHANRAKVTILSHNLIYHLEEDLKQCLSKIQNELKTVDVTLGQAGVVRIFEEGKIAGCTVRDGQLSVGDRANVLRFPDLNSGKTEREVVFSGSINSIKQFAKSVRSVKKGTECGISIDAWSDFRAGDLIESVASRKMSEVS